MFRYQCSAKLCKLYEKNQLFEKFEEKNVTVKNCSL